MWARFLLDIKEEEKMKNNLFKNKQKVHKKTITSYISLPILIVEAINNLGLSKTDTSH